MTIEQAAQQLAEAVQATCEAIKDVDPTSIYIDRNGICVHVLNKEVFGDIDSEQTSLDWHGNNRKYCKMVKRVAGVDFYTLIEASDTSAPYIQIPPDVAKKAMELMGRGKTNAKDSVSV